MSRLHGTCWAITDDSAGNQRQALALAEALAMPVRHLVLEPRAPWSWLAPRLIAGVEWSLVPTQRTLFAPPWPTVAVGCGRAAALFTRALRGLTDGRCHTAQILDPRIDPVHWDTVVAPRHDRLSGPNVIGLLGSLNPVDDAWLADGREAFPALGRLPSPRVGVLLGGPRKGLILDADYAQRLGARLRDLQRQHGGSLMLLTSRRTPADLLAPLRDTLGHAPNLFWTGPTDGPNPYPGVLGWAQRLVVTPDSVNMLSEACAVGCPVQTLVSAPLPAKIERFHRALRAAGLLHDLAADTPARTQPALRETAAVAAQVRDRVAARQAIAE